VAGQAVKITEAEERELRRRASQYTRPYREVIRAKLVLLAAEGLTDKEVAARLDCTDRMVAKWRRRFVAKGLAGLDERPRPGRPRSFPPGQIAEVKALACELPAQTGRPISRWSAAELAREAVARGIVCQVSGTTVWRWLAEDAIRPWAWRSWVFARDPDFRAKAGRVLDLYARRWEGQRLHLGDYVISADEKTQLQALPRRHPLVAAGPGRRGLVEHEYRRCGTLPALRSSEQRVGERVRVRVRTELAALLHSQQASTQQGFPALKAGCEVRL
jgi:transposase